MFKNIGQCCCGQTKISIILPESLKQYSSRLCDCDFCVTRNISYLSDPYGELKIESEELLDIQQQGSDQASFITCSKCKSVIAVSYQLDDKLIGALNSTLLSDSKLLLKPTVVSPKALGAKEKVARWKKLWMNIIVNGNNYI